MAEDEYITNMPSELLEEGAALKKTQEELAKVKAELDEKNKLCLSQKHQIEDLNIESKDLKEKLNNQNNLIKFYEDKAEKEGVEQDPEKKDIIKQLEIQIMNLNEKIKELEESIIKKERKQKKEKYNSYN